MSESCEINNDHWRELEEWRGKIDEIDRQVAALLCQRLQFAGNISSVKSRIGEAVLQPEREKEVLINVLAHTDSPAMSQALERIYHSILNESRLFQQEYKNGQQNHSSR
ncbi:MAG TPA: chorismate mutase [Chlorobaculum sp.]|uniref:chorismate mutase n=1 Tax=Chlorobaculum tepidum (strain ATCC 49652 / DSM 12025 / NBRC 103806 / TLS) TaxID=194439 RepID=Q8KAD9_CHLTE|nr:chorismate mutase [Chlorobaculum tepidum]AAM73440.1 chorismate mutase, putative [Chlorobaculum tepidum TLS]HBU23181.1 chorismate mutase [Chlorobaculum sp.]